MRAAIVLVAGLFSGGCFADDWDELRDDLPTWEGRTPYEISAAIVGSTLISDKWDHSRAMMRLAASVRTTEDRVSVSTATRRAILRVRGADDGVLRYLAKALISTGDAGTSSLLIKIAANRRQRPEARYTALYFAQRAGYLDPKSIALLKGIIRGRKGNLMVRLEAIRALGKADERWLGKYYDSNPAIRLAIAQALSP
jgi:hypothetical protein